IAKDKHALIFSDFEQANKETTRKYGGTGLGLSIVKRLLKIQGGSINLKSKVGEGSTFTFTLPFDMVVKNKPKKVTEQQNLEDDNVLNNKNVLLVEDNMLNQMVATKFLESMGLKVCVANNGQEGVDHLQNSDFDIVLMDIQMPIMDGYTATHFIRKSIKGKKSKTPILAMTAHAISGEKEKCLGAGMNDYIAKPLKREHLKLKIINLIKN
ncbi:MAG: response regulator, partial [Flavobacteriales bacterium]|nr:response regulator [Flavobacteriales bacterium]